MKKGQLVFGEDLGIFGSISNPPPLEWRTEVRDEYDVRILSGMIGYQRWATVKLGVFEACEGGDEIEIEGIITPNEFTKARSLEVYIVSWNMRLG